MSWRGRRRAAADPLGKNMESGSDSCGKTGLLDVEGVSEIHEGAGAGVFSVEGKTRLEERKVDTEEGGGFVWVDADGGGGRKGGDGACEQRGSLQGVGVGHAGDRGKGGPFSEEQTRRNRQFREEGQMIHGDCKADADEKLALVLGDGDGGGDREGGGVASERNGDGEAGGGPVEEEERKEGSVEARVSCCDVRLFVQKIHHFPRFVSVQP